MTREEWMYITSLRQLEKLEQVKEKTKLDKIYNKALQYERYDIIVKMAYLIAQNKRQPYNITAINQFYAWVQTYEMTGIAEYKDKATGKYWHYILWDKIVTALEYETAPFRPLGKLKKDIIKVNKLPRPLRGDCYACSAVLCSKCKLKMVPCSFPHSPWSVLTRAINNNDREKAAKYAEVIRDAWKA